MNPHTRTVLFIVNSLCFGGAEKQLVSLLNGMDNKKFKISLAYLKHDETLLPQLDQDRLDKVFCCDVSRRIDFRAIRLLARYIRETKTDVIVCTNEYSMLYGFLARRLSGLKSRLIEVFHTTELPSTYEKFKNILYKKIFNRCDMIIFVSKNQQEYWIKRRGVSLKRSTCIYNGIDVEHFTDCYSQHEKVLLRNRLGFTEKDYVVGICARLQPEKKHTDFLDTLKLLKRQGISIKGLIIGDGPLRPSIESYIVEHSLGKHVVITGYQQDVRPFIAICDCMVLNSTAETFSIAALEAMAMRKPLVSTNIGGANEQITNGVNGFLFEKGNISSLSEHLLSLFDPKQREKMGRSAMKVVQEKFTVDKMISEYEKIFAEL